MSIDLSFLEGRLTISVEEFARLTGIGRTSAYNAARRGEIPVRWIGRRAVVPVPLLLTWLGISATPPLHDGAIPMASTSERVSE